MNRFDTTIILSHTHNHNGEFSEECKKRVEHGAAYLINGETHTLTMSGRASWREVLEVPHTHASLMEKYAVEKLNVPPTSILLETESLDTVGQAVFTKLSVVKPRDFRTLQVVSSDYHMPRVEQIFRKVYGDAYTIGFQGMKTELVSDPAIIEREKRSLDSFLDTFKHVTPGDDLNIVRALFVRHKIYRNLRHLTNVYGCEDILNFYTEMVRVNRK
ncbi:YdcF family protein [Candidatus Pacearchaeota archaeon]|nr:YdcF family protein [Candidatus Pacearchaeota archaeon]